jgi:hypothetical protein
VAWWRGFSLRLARTGGVLGGLLLLASVPLSAPNQAAAVRRPPLAAIGLPPAARPASDRGPSDEIALLHRAAGRIVGDPVLGLTVLLLVGTVSLGLARRSWTVSLHPGHLLAALALAELALHGRTLIQVAPARAFLGPDPISREILKLSEADPSGAPPRVRAQNHVYPDLLAIRHGIEKTDVNDVFQLEHAAVLYEPIYALAATSAPRRPAGAAMPDPETRRRIRQAALDRMAVSYLVSERVPRDPAWPVVAAGDDHAGRPFVIQRNPTALPRAYVVPRARVQPPDQTVDPGSFLLDDPRETVLVPADPLASLPDGRRQPFTPALWAGRDPDRPAIEVTTAAPGLLVIADTWMPGWSARLDGRPVPVHRGNHSQRVIALPSAGAHRIQLEYHPPGLPLGGSITLLSAVLLVGLAAGGRRPGMHLRGQPD